MSACVAAVAATAVARRQQRSLHEATTIRGGDDDAAHRHPPPLAGQGSDSDSRGECMLPQCICIVPYLQSRMAAATVRDAAAGPWQASTAALCGWHRHGQPQPQPQPVEVEGNCSTRSTWRRSRGMTTCVTSTRTTHGRCNFHCACLNVSFASVTLCDNAKAASIELVTAARRVGCRSERRQLLVSHSPHAAARPLRPAAAAE